MKAAWKPFRQDFEVQMVSFRQHSRQIEEEARLAHRIEAARMYEIQLANRALQIRNDKLHRRHRTLSALPSADYLGKYSKLINFKHPGTNMWLSATDQYSSWYGSQTSDCLCCYGIPGSGKSILAASIVESLMAIQRNDTFIVCQYYCDYADSVSLDPYSLVASLLKQALQYVSLEKFTEDFKFNFDDDKALPNLETMVSDLVEILQDFRSVFVILDGIDELAQDNQPVVLSMIDNLIKHHPNLKVFVTSRIEEYRIRKAMTAYRSIRLSQSYVKDDIVRYVQDQLDKADISSPISREPKLKEEVLEALVAGAKGM